MNPVPATSHSCLFAPHPLGDEAPSCCRASGCQPGDETQVLKRMAVWTLPALQRIYSWWRTRQRCLSGCQHGRTAYILHTVGLRPIVGIVASLLYSTGSTKSIQRTVPPAAFGSCSFGLPARRLVQPLFFSLLDIFFLSFSSPSAYQRDRHCAFFLSELSIESCQLGLPQILPLHPSQHASWPLTCCAASSHPQQLLRARVPASRLVRALLQALPGTVE